MTMSETGERVRQVVDGAIGKGAIALLLAIVLGLSGFALRATVDHSADLAEIHADVRDLVDLVRTHNVEVDGKINHIVDAEQIVRDEVIELQAAQRIHDREERDVAPRRMPDP